jgi:hypothetical protein
MYLTCSTGTVQTTLLPDWTCRLKSHSSIYWWVLYFREQTLPFHRNTKLTQLNRCHICDQRDPSMESCLDTSWREERQHRQLDCLLWCGCVNTTGLHAAFNSSSPSVSINNPFFPTYFNLLPLLFFLPFHFFSSSCFLCLRPRLIIHASETKHQSVVLLELNLLEQFQRCKTTGTDNTPAEMIQAGGKTLRSEIHTGISCDWNKEELPEQWRNLSMHVYNKWRSRTDLRAYVP